MSELQVSLIAIGFIVVMGVIFFNWLQQRRYRRHAEQAFSQKHEDVLLRTTAPLEEGRIEPQLGPAETSHEVEAEPKLNEPVEAAPETPEQPVTPAVSLERPSAPVEKPAPPLTAVFDGTVDYVVNISSEKKIENSGLGALLQRKFDFSKPVRWLGQTGSETAWEDITSDVNGKADYFALRGCLQLADRAGPVSEVHLSEFRDMAENFCAGINARARCPDVHKAYAQALALDEFCSEVDVMIGITIISRDGGAVTGAKIRMVAEASGFKLGADGMFSFRGENGSTLFSLGNLEPHPFLPDTLRTLTTRGVTFLLDVPRTSNGEMVFEDMVRVAEAFADSVGGIMVDDNNIPLSAEGIEKIQQQLMAIESMMATRGIPAGSEVARRLFA
ncbi:MAG TPA: cell division protein ZipA C-terminal FtsZ-binding domain-containing protein [Nitrosospira sp.]|nr:cell division protein ZipA C-terminal FtsZ-binding domain-containing protein [Nitrosospira sp.]